MTEWKEMETGVWNPEPGNSIEGILLKKEEKKEDQSAKYHLEIKPGEQMMLWGSAILDDRMVGVHIGDKIRITLKEIKQLDKKKTLKIYKVEVAQDNEVEEKTLPEAEEHIKVMEEKVDIE